MYWNWLIRLLIESMLEICLLGVMDLKIGNVSTSGNILSYGLSAFLILTVVGYVLWIPLYLKQDTKDLMKPESRIRFGEVYDGFNRDHLKASLKQAEYFVYR